MKKQLLMLMSVIGLAIFLVSCNNTNLNVKPKGKLVNLSNEQLMAIFSNLEIKNREEGYLKSSEQYYFYNNDSKDTLLEDFKFTNYYNLDTKELYVDSTFKIDRKNDNIKLNGYMNGYEDSEKLYVDMKINANQNDLAVKQGKYQFDVYERLPIMFNSNLQYFQLKYYVRQRDISFDDIRFYVEKVKSLLTINKDIIKTYQNSEYFSIEISFNLRDLKNMDNQVSKVVVESLGINYDHSMHHIFKKVDYKAVFVFKNNLIEAASINMTRIYEIKRITERRNTKLEYVNKMPNAINKNSYLAIDGEQALFD